jgi:anti-sigma B factor antagonist
MDWLISSPDAEGFECVALKGDCDLYAAPSFSKAMRDRIAGGAKRLRFDLSGVDYLDSTGVGALIRILQEARRSGTELKFSGIKGSPRKVLRMANILPLMHEEQQP